MRISDTEPSSVSLGQTEELKKFKTVVQKCQKQAEAKRDGVKKKLKKLQFQLILRRKIWCSQNASNQPKSHALIDLVSAFIPDF